MNGCVVDKFIIADHEGLMCGIGCHEGLKLFPIYCDKNDIKVIGIFVSRPLCNSLECRYTD